MMWSTISSLTSSISGALRVFITKQIEMNLLYSLENETSFNAIYNYYAKMAQYRNIQEIPIILVGTQGNILVLTLSEYYKQS